MSSSADTGPVATAGGSTGRPLWLLLSGIIQAVLGSLAVAMAVGVHLTDENREWYIDHNFYLGLLLLLSGGLRLMLSIGLRRAPGFLWFVAGAVLAAGSGAGVLGVRAVVFRDLERIPLENYKGFEQAFAVLGSWTQIVGISAIVLVAFVLVDGLLGVGHALAYRRSRPRLWVCMLAGGAIGLVVGADLCLVSRAAGVSLMGLFLQGDPGFGLSGSFTMSITATLGLGVSMLCGGCACVITAAGGRSQPTRAVSATPSA